MEDFKDSPSRKVVSDTASQISVAHIGRENLADALPPHESYEGSHRYDPAATWTEAEERSVVRKTDLHLLLWICVMFFGLQLDRGNLSNATADNLLKDLKLTTDDYNNGTTIQLLCFLTAEFPVQFLTKRYGFKYILPIMMMLWGTVSWTQAWMHDRTSFYITRALIGLCEGGFIPGTILFATYFYKSKELSVRLACFWSTLNIARVISALLAAGILTMRGVGGKPGWFYLFLIEGLFTFLIGVISILYLPQSPTKTSSVLCRRSWYTEREEIIMVNRILRDDPAKGLTALQEPATFKDIREAWSDSSMWGLYFIGLVAYIPATPVQSYITLTLRRLGYTTFDSNMLTIPSAALQVITMLVLAYSSDFFDEHPYFHPIVSAWISENTFDVKKRAVTAATYNVIVQVGSLIGSQIYRSYDAPYYKQGNKVLVSICALSLVTFVAQRQYLIVLNKKKEKVWGRMTAEEKAAYQNDSVAREKDGNKRLDFRFKY
ncbi:hypothetical protein OCU04_011121 [Sclerotinia nivalis]|uniref:Major facilitator superfamily (MFS) profile domain-containing protein n=1 Tax=Sclerotinia nivalis TaxID=352851 RepID=A0A9X0AAV0_9HELO|nr:hypothetical protein OCU04_011121 [Sclerotinia nivalis]